MLHTKKPSWNSPFIPCNRARDFHMFRASTKAKNSFLKRVLEESGKNNKKLLWVWALTPSGVEAQARSGISSISLTASINSVSALPSELWLRNCLCTQNFSKISKFLKIHSSYAWCHRILKFYVKSPLRGPLQCECYTQSDLCIPSDVSEYINFT